MSLRTTVRLPEDLLARAKRKAAAEGRTLTALIEDGLRLVISEDRKNKASGRKLPRVSTVVGAPTSAFDINRLREIEELEDLEYIERLRNGFK